MQRLFTAFTKKGCNVLGIVGLASAEPRQCVDCWPMGWRKDLGALLLVQRVQEKKWNVSEAATAAKINAGTVTRIEAGTNYQVRKLEMYAETLGRPLEQWLRDMLHLKSESGDAALMELWAELEAPDRATLLGVIQGFVEKVRLERARNEPPATAAGQTAPVKPKRRHGP